MKYRPIVKMVEAHQYTGHNAEDLGERFEIGRQYGLHTIYTGNCEVSLDEGDWIVVNEKRQVTIISDANFRARYEPAE
jgi:hypothetical protein